MSNWKFAIVFSLILNVVVFSRIYRCEMYGSVGPVINLQTQTLLSWNEVFSYIFDVKLTSWASIINLRYFKMHLLTLSSKIWSWITCRLYKHFKIISSLTTWVMNDQNMSDCTIGSTSMFDALVLSSYEVPYACHFSPFTT